VATTELIHHEVRSKKNPDMFFRILLFRNFLSPELLKRAQRKLDIRLFQQGEKGKKNAYIRVANKHGIPSDTPFVVGTPGHCTLYGGVEADDFEQELIELVQYVMDMVNDVVKDNIDEHY
jgi:hypothetical protein